MGCKYTIRFIRNGLCDYEFDRKTNNIFRALWFLLTLSLKYPIVTLEVRRGYIPCEECNADWCDKSAAYKVNTSVTKKKPCGWTEHEDGTFSVAYEEEND